jgi:hypothetical protein
MTKTTTKTETDTTVADMLAGAPKIRALSPEDTDVLNDAIRTSMGNETAATRMIDAATILKELSRDFYAADILATAIGVEPSVFDVASRIDEVFSDYAEGLAISLPHDVEVVWRKKARTKGGATVFGDLALIPKRDRDLHPSPARFRMTLAIAPWLAMGEKERLRLLHHELMHAVVDVDEEGNEKAKTRTHDIEEFAATGKLFGYEEDGLWAGVRKTIRDLVEHETVRVWLADSSGNLNLFRYEDRSGS